VLDRLRQLGAGPLTLGLLRSFLRNRPPTVVLSAEQISVQQGETLNLYADARDPDGDELEYFWETSAGILRTEGGTARLDTADIPLEAGATAVSVTLTVFDRKGGSDSSTRSIVVRAKRLVSGTDSPEPVTPRHDSIRRVWAEGKYALVQFEGEPSRNPGAWGFIEVAFNGGATVPVLQSITGSLPGVRCRADLIVRENVAEYSFKEPPGSFNDYRRLVVRVRPRDAKRPVRFAVYWQALDSK